MSKRKIDPYHGHSIDPEDIKPRPLKGPAMSEVQDDYYWRERAYAAEAERDRLREQRDAAYVQIRLEAEKRDRLQRRIKRAANILRPVVQRNEMNTTAHFDALGVLEGTDLSREVDRLREDYAEAQAGWDKVSDENDRLREALERIAAQHGWCTEVQTHVLARRALGGTSDE